MDRGAPVIRERNREVTEEKVINANERISASPQHLPHFTLTNDRASSSGKQTRNGCSAVTLYNFEQKKSFEWKKRVG
jgi:hypothetical protein